MEPAFFKGLFPFFEGLFLFFERCVAEGLIGGLDASSQPVYNEALSIQPGAFEIQESLPFGSIGSWPGRTGVVVVAVVGAGASTTSTASRADVEVISGDRDVNDCKFSTES